MRIDFSLGRRRYAVKKGAEPRGRRLILEIGSRFRGYDWPCFPNSPDRPGSTPGFAVGIGLFIFAGAFAKGFHLAVQTCHMLYRQDEQDAGTRLLKLPGRTDRRNHRRNQVFFE